MAAKKVSRKRHIKRNIESGIAHIYSTFNNTIIMVTDTRGDALAWSSVGSLGFKGGKKPTPFAAQMATETTTKMAMERKLKAIDVTVRGPGSGHEAAIRSLQVTGSEVIAIRDVTPVPHNGYHPPEHRHV